MFFDGGVCELFTSNGPAQSEIYGLAPLKEARVALWRDGALVTGELVEVTVWELVDIWDKGGPDEPRPVSEAYRLQGP